MSLFGVKVIRPRLVLVVKSIFFVRKMMELPQLKFWRDGNRFINLVTIGVSKAGTAFQQ